MFEIMRILQIIPTLGTGGAEHFVVELSNELCRQGHDVEVLTLYAIPEGNHLRDALDSRIKVTSLNKKRGLWLKGFFSVWSFIKKKEYDVVHGHVGAIKYMTLASLFCSKENFVATIHSEAKREAGKFVDKWSRKLMFNLRTCFPVTVSDESERSFEAFYGKNTAMIVNGVSTYQQQKEVVLRDNDRQTVFLHVASCQLVKNQKLLLKAFNRLQEDGVDAKLVWVGSNTTFMELFHSLEPLMQRNVSFLGVVDGVRDYMVAADAVCLSSKMEGMPMTIIEAFSVGRPALCTPVGGCVNMIKTGENGMLSENLTVDAYYKMLSSFVALPENERIQMSNNAQESFQKYTIENCAISYLKVYENGYHQ